MVTDHTESRIIFMYYGLVLVVDGFFDRWSLWICSNVKSSAKDMDIEVKVIYDVFYILSLTFFMEGFAHFYIFYLEDDGVNNLEMELFV